MVIKEDIKRDMKEVTENEERNISCLKRIHFPAKREHCAIRLLLFFKSQVRKLMLFMNYE